MPKLRIVNERRVLTHAAARWEVIERARFRIDAVHPVVVLKPPTEQSGAGRTTDLHANNIRTVLSAAFL